MDCVFSSEQALYPTADGAVSHEQLYIEATQYHFEDAKPPIHTPKILIKPGIHGRCFLGRFASENPFEKPWMADYVDKELTVDASRTRERLDWAPKRRLDASAPVPEDRPGA